MKTLKLTAAEAIVKFLDNQYIVFDGEEIKFVENFYTLFGHGCVLGLGQALAGDNHSFKVLQGKNEQGMAHAAIAYAKQHNRRKIIPVTSSIGPGAANMVTAAATATVNNIPLLLFPGDTFASRQPDPVLQQLEQPYDLNITTNDAYRPVVRYFDRISRPELVMSAMVNAMRALTDIAHTGAVCISLPQDVQGESYDYPEEFFLKRCHRIVRPGAIIEEIEKASELILKSERPLIIAGGGVRYSEAGDELMKFASEFNIPVAETQAGKSAIPASFPLNLGGIGVTGNLAANTIAEEADLIIGVGTRFSDFTTSSKYLYSKAQVITVNASAYHGGKLDALKLTGDCKAVLNQLNNEFTLKGYKSKYTEEIRVAKEQWRKEYLRLKSKSVSDETEVIDKSPDTVQAFLKAVNTSITQTAAIALINETIDKDAIIVGASGSLPGCLQRMWETDSPYSYNMEYGYSCMGYEIAGAFGSKLAAPDREVYAMVGDGSYLMLHSELVTAIQENIKINVLLFDNGGFGCINNLQMGQGIKSLATEFRTGAGEFMSIDYAKSAEAYGAKAYTVRTLKELKAALLDAKKASCPVLIDIKVLPKSMSVGYNSWWNVGCTALPKNDKQKEALNDRIEHLARARRY